MQSVIGEEQEQAVEVKLDLKLEITKETLVDVLDGVYQVSTNGIKTEFDFARNVTINVVDDKVEFITTNGHLDARWVIDKEMDNKLLIHTNGKVTVEIGMIKGICNSLGGSGSDTHVFSVSVKNKSLHIVDLSAEKKEGQKKRAQIETSYKNHVGLTFVKPKNPKTTIKFDTDMFCDGISSVKEYASDQQYKEHYGMICLRLLQNRTEMTAGCGLRFGIFSYKPTNMNDVPEEPENAKIKDATIYLFPVPQAKIITNIIGDDAVTFYFKDKTYYYFECGNLTAVLKGVPNLDYIDYWRHATQKDKALCIVDIKKEDLNEAVALIGSVEDNAVTEQGVFHSCNCVYKEGEKAELFVDEGRYQADITIPCEFYNIDTDKYKDEYSWEYLNDTSGACDKTHVRMYCLSSGIIIADIIDREEDEKDDRGVPAIKQKDDYAPKMRFFFGNVNK